LGRLPKVTRRKGGTLIRHHQKTGYSPKTTQSMVGPEAAIAGKPAPTSFALSLQQGCRIEPISIDPLSTSIYANNAINRLLHLRHHPPQ
jgi:hypothetical protein